MSEVKTHVIDGKKYVDVQRKANVGEKVIGIYSGSIHEITKVDYDGRAFANGWSAKSENYRVLERVDQAPSYKLNDLLAQITPENKHEETPLSLEDLIANLVRRVASLEQQLRDVQGNIERQGVEIAEIAYATQAPQSGAKLLAEAFEALAKYERSVGR